LKDVAISEENRETKRDFRRILFCTTERDEELLAPIMQILDFFLVLAIAEVFTGDGLILFVLTTVIKSPSEKISPVAIFLAGAVSAVVPGLPPTVPTTSLYILP
jgi:hypothetical protein